MYDAPIVFFLIVTLFVEIRSHCQIKRIHLDAFKCPLFNACCRCAFTKRLVVFHFRCILYVVFLFQFLRWVNARLHLDVFVCAASTLLLLEKNIHTNMYCTYV